MRVGCELWVEDEDVGAFGDRIDHEKQAFIRMVPGHTGSTRLRANQVVRDAVKKVLVLEDIIELDQ